MIRLFCSVLILSFLVGCKSKSPENHGNSSPYRGSNFEDLFLPPGKLVKIEESLDEKLTFYFEHQSEQTTDQIFHLIRRRNETNGWSEISAHPPNFLILEKGDLSGAYSVTKTDDVIYVTIIVQDEVNGVEKYRKLRAPDRF